MITVVETERSFLRVGFPKEVDRGRLVEFMVTHPYWNVSIEYDALLVFKGEDNGDL